LKAGFVVLPTPSCYMQAAKSMMAGWRVVALLIASTACAGCPGGGRPSSPVGVTVGRLSVTSQAFEPNGAIPVDCSCDGEDRSPPLAWSAAPEGTRALAVVVDDPDALGGEVTHWLAYEIPPATTTLPEAVDAAALGGEEGTNSFGRPGYSGPCPPRHELHRYEFHVFALDAPLAVRAGATRDAVDTAMSQHVLAEGVLVGTFGH
jgi:Raf kinase inhibitor-like YbhB/YbcL family protein